MSHVALVSDYMARDVVTLSPELEINHAMTRLMDYRVSGAPVLDANGNLVGILSKRDCLKAAIEASYYRDWGSTVATHMSTDVQTLDAGLDILSAAKAFVDSPYRRFPVMENGRFVGQISRTDALRALVENWA